MIRGFFKNSFRTIRERLIEFRDMQPSKQNLILTLIVVGTLSSQLISALHDNRQRIMAEREIEKLTMRAYGRADINPSDVEAQHIFYNDITEDGIAPDYVVRLKGEDRNRIVPGVEDYTPR